MLEVARCVRSEARGGMARLKRNANESIRRLRRRNASRDQRARRRQPPPPHNQISGETRATNPRGRPIEFKDAMHSRESGQNFGAFGGRRDGPFHGAGSARNSPVRRFVAQHANHEDVALRARLFQQTNVAGMKQIEATSHEHDALAVAFPLAALENQLFLRDNLAQFPAPSVRMAVKNEITPILPRRLRMPAERQMKRLGSHLGRRWAVLLASRAHGNSRWRNCRRRLRSMPRGCRTPVTVLEPPPDAKPQAA